MLKSENTEATVKKCGRCRKLYDHYPTGKKVQYNAILRIQRSDAGEIVWGIRSLVTDLCPECMDEFEKFMTAKLVEEKK